MIPPSVTPSDPRAVDDLGLFLSRAARIDDGSVRLMGGGGALAVYVPALFPAGLGDPTPTVLGLRVLRIDEQDGFDVVVPLASLRTRIERAIATRGSEEARTEIGIPPQAPSVIWAAITPPRGGWRALGPVAPATLESAAREGIAEVAAAVPGALGESIVRRVRAEVWGRPIAGAEHLPAGAAFAAYSLGFLGLEADASAPAMECFDSGAWSRLSSPRGHVLIKRPSWTLAP